MNERFLSPYLTDRDAALTAGVEVARRTLNSNRGTAYEAPLEQAVAALEADQRLLHRIMAAHGVRRSALKTRGAWLGEKLGRLKLNGRLTGYSPLSRVVELDGIVAIVSLSAGLWQGLAPLLGDAEVDAAAERADATLGALTAIRPDAVREALS